MLPTGNTRHRHPTIGQPVWHDPLHRSKTLYLRAGPAFRRTGRLRSGLHAVGPTAVAEHGLHYVQAVCFASRGRWVLPMKALSVPAIAASPSAGSTPTGDEPPALGLRGAIKPRHTAACAALAVVYLIANYVPLRATDLWSHVRFGQWILDHGRMPSADPTQWLAEGMPVIDSAWLSQVLLAAVERLGGAQWLSNLFAVVTLITVCIWARIFYLRTQRFGSAALATTLMLIFGFSRLTTLRPETFATACFAVFVWLLSRNTQSSNRFDDATWPRWSWAPFFSASSPLSPPRGQSVLWLALPLTMAVWTNLHGSFVIGLLLLACGTLGHAVQIVRQKGRLAALWTDGELQRWILLSQLCAAATLLNPYGLRLLFYVTSFTSHPAVATISEWQPLALLGTGGREFAFSWLLLTLVWRRSRRPIHPTSLLLLAATGWATVHQVRMIAWYAPMAALALAPHLANLLPQSGFAPPWGRPLQTKNDARHSTAHWWPALTCALIVWTALAWSGVGQAILGQPVRSARRLYGSDTPLAVAEYLNEHPPAGPIFNPQWWGDWLVWRGPRDLMVFVTTQMHLLPPHVFQDYQRVVDVAPGWQTTLDRYAISTVIVDPIRQTRLAAAMQTSDSWQLVYEDAQARVYQRQLEITGKVLTRREPEPQKTTASHRDTANRRSASVQG